MAMDWRETKSAEEELMVGGRRRRSAGKAPRGVVDCARRMGYPRRLRREVEIECALLYACRLTWSGRAVLRAMDRAACEECIDCPAHPSHVLTAHRSDLVPTIHTHWRCDDARRAERGCWASIGCARKQRCSAVLCAVHDDGRFIVDFVDVNDDDASMHHTIDTGRPSATARNELPRSAVQRARSPLARHPAARLLPLLHRPSWRTRRTRPCPTCTAWILSR